MAPRTSLPDSLRSTSPPSSGRQRIYLIDDHAVFRDGLAGLLNRMTDLEVCGGSGSGHGALEDLDRRSPTLIITELTLPDMNGLELLKQLKAKRPQLPVLVLSMLDESFYAERCLRSGARGYIMKKEAIEQVEHAVRQILEGRVYLSQKMSDQFLLAVARGDAAKIGSPVHSLSDRELEVFECIGHGLGASEIARKLHLSVKTIESYQAKLKEKLHLKDSTQLFQHALHWVERR